MAADEKKHQNGLQIQFESTQSHRYLLYGYPLASGGGGMIALNP